LKEETLKAYCYISLVLLQFEKQFIELTKFEFGASFLSD